MKRKRFIKVHLDDEKITEEKEFTVDEAEHGKRVDVFLTEQNPDFTRSHLQKLISEGLILVRDKSVKANYKLKEGDKIVFKIPEPEKLEVLSENIPIEILYEDKDLIVVHKAQGMVVHPAPGNYSGTLVNALLYHCKDLSGINGVLRPGIVHRLDKDTSGVMVAAKNDKAHLSLATQIKDRTANRKYYALVHGNVAEPAGVINAPLGRNPKERIKMAVSTINSKDATTRYHVLERFGEYTLIECKLETGRTHQIRVHMAYLNHAVVGDPLYGPKKVHFKLKGQLLHAYLLGFEHPSTGEYMEFKAERPQYFEKVLRNLR